MYFLIASGKKSLYYEMFDDKSSLEEHINRRRRFFNKKFQNNLAYIVKGDEILPARKYLEEESNNNLE